MCGDDLYIRNICRRAQITLDKQPYRLLAVNTSRRFLARPHVFRCRRKSCCFYLSVHPTKPPADDAERRRAPLRLPKAHTEPDFWVGRSGWGPFLGGHSTSQGNYLSVRHTGGRRHVYSRRSLRFAHMRGTIRPAVSFAVRSQSQSPPCSKRVGASAWLPLAPHCLCHPRRFPSSSERVHRSHWSLNPRCGIRDTR